jgi:hypothetical protein
MFAVAARSERPGPPPQAVPGRPRWFDAGSAPVGIQHAPPAMCSDGATRQPRCGADLASWVIFAGQPFELGGKASCRRCTQLVSADQQEPTA